MNERQRGLFLWLWSRRRQADRSAFALRALAIGALGGVAVALFMITSVDTGGRTGVDALLAAVERAGIVLLLAIALFAGIGYLLANRVFATHERIDQSMLATGARVPDEKPAMTPGDRTTAIAAALAVAATVIALFILYLFVRLG